MLCFFFVCLNPTFYYADCREWQCRRLINLTYFFFVGRDSLCGRVQWLQTTHPKNLQQKIISPTKKKGTHSFIKGNKIKKKKKENHADQLTSILFHYYLITRTIEQDLSLNIYIYIYIFTANRIDDRYNNGWNFGRRAGREGGGVTECAPSSELLIKLNPMAPLDCIGGGKIIL